MRACLEHLNSKETNSDGSTKPYYEEVNEDKIEEAKNEIHILLEEGLDNNILTKAEYEAINPSDKNSKILFKF